MNQQPTAPATPLHNPIQEQDDTLYNGTPTPTEIRQNRIDLMKEQQANSNQPFDPDVGVPMDSPNPQTPNPFETAQAVPPTPAAPVTQTVQPAPAQPVPGQPPATPNTHPFQPQPQPAPVVPTPPAPAQPIVGTPPADPNQPTQPPADPALAGLTPEEQQTVTQLNGLMAEQVEPTQPAGNMTQEQIQTMLMTLANNQQQMFNVMQNPAVQPGVLQNTPGQFGTAAIPDPNDPLSNINGLPNPPPQDPFNWNVQPPQQQGIDPTSQLLMASIQKLQQQVANVNNSFQQSQAQLKRENDIQGLMNSNGINRQHAERAQDFFDKGDFQKGSQVLMLASAPVIARLQATQEREIQRDAAGQPLTPVQPGGVFTAPDQNQALNAEWTQLNAQPNGEGKRLKIVQFLQKNPQFGAEQFEGLMSTPAAPLNSSI